MGETPPSTPPPTPHPHCSCTFICVLGMFSASWIGLYVRLSWPLASHFSLWVLYSFTWKWWAGGSWRGTGFRSGILHSGCTLESPGEFYNGRYPGSTCRDSDWLIGWGVSSGDLMYSLGWQSPHWMYLKSSGSYIPWFWIILRNSAFSIAIRILHENFLNLRILMIKTLSMCSKYYFKTWISYSLNSLENKQIFQTSRRQINSRHSKYRKAPKLLWNSQKDTRESKSRHGNEIGWISDYMLGVHYLDCLLWHQRQRHCLTWGFQPLASSLWIQWEQITTEHCR